MFKEFKEFAMKGNVLDMAIGIIMGAAFTPIVNSLVKDIIMPPIGVVLGKVDFSGVVKEVCLAYTPEVEAGQWVVVHVGFAISLIDETEARKVFQYLEEFGELLELQDEAGAPEMQNMQKMEKTPKREN
mgnify:CR=1 FL=1